MKAYFQRLLAYAAWASRRVISAVRATPEAHAEAMPLLAHMLAAEHVWLARLEHREPTHAVWPTLSLEQCAALADENQAGYQAFLSQLDESRLTELIRYSNSRGDSFATSVADILTHVALHGPYHRGQLAKIIARCGGTAINTDFIMFEREHS